MNLGQYGFQALRFPKNCNQPFIRLFTLFQRNNIGWDLSDTILEDVHWEAIIALASKEVSRVKRTFVSKSAVGMCGVGKFLKRWKQATSAKCPRCGEAVEDMEHVLRCPHNEPS
jgi:hypothetical protein